MFFSMRSLVFGVTGLTLAMTLPSVVCAQSIDQSLINICQTFAENGKDTHNLVQWQSKLRSLKAAYHSERIRDYSHLQDISRKIGVDVEDIFKFSSKAKSNSSEFRKEFDKVMSSRETSLIDQGFVNENTSQVSSILSAGLNHCVGILAEYFTKRDGIFLEASPATSDFGQFTVVVRTNTLQDGDVKVVNISPGTDRIQCFNSTDVGDVLKTGYDLNRHALLSCKKDANETIALTISTNKGVTSGSAKLLGMSEVRQKDLVFEIEDLRREMMEAHAVMEASALRRSIVVETGELTKDYYPKGNMYAFGSISDEFNIIFENDFRETPKLMASIAGFSIETGDSNNKDADAIISVEVLKVTPKQATLKVQKHKAMVAGVKLRWMAVGHPAELE